MAGLFDDIISRQVGIERVKAGESKRIQLLLKELDNKIFFILNNLPSDYTQSQLNSSLMKISDLVENFYAIEILSTHKAIVSGVVNSEIDFASGLLTKYLTSEKVAKPKIANVIQSVLTTPYQNKTLPNWTRDLATDKINRVSSAVRESALEFKQPSELATSAKRAIKIANNNSDTITKSYINQSVNNSRDIVYDFNEEAVEVIIWSSILDGHTTAPCQARSNQKYDARTKQPIGHDNAWEGGPGVIHFGCRSAGIPTNEAGVIAGGAADGEKFDSGTRTAIGAEDDFKKGGLIKEDGRVAKLPSKNNDLKKELVPANLNYEDWLRTQPKAFIEDVLGTGKAKLFIDKKVSLQKFVVPDGTELTLEQFLQKAS